MLTLINCCVHLLGHRLLTLPNILRPPRLLFILLVLLILFLILILRGLAVFFSFFFFESPLICSLYLLFNHELILDEVALHLLHTLPLPPVLLPHLAE